MSRPSRSVSNPRTKAHRSTRFESRNNLLTHVISIINVHNYFTNNITNNQILHKKKEQIILQITKTFLNYFWIEKSINIKTAHGYHKH